MKKFKKGEIVYFTIEGMNAGELMVAIPSTSVMKFIFLYF